MNEFEYVYISKEQLEFPLDDSINILNADDKENCTCIISNSNKIKAEIVAPEIDFYINNSDDDLSTKISSVKTLYDARMIAFDMARYFDYEQEIGNLLIVVSKDDPSILPKLKESGFKVICLKPEQIAYTEGHIGELKVGVIVEKDEIKEVKTDQMIWFDAPKTALKQSGIYD